MIENLAVDFDLDIFRNADYTQHYGSCISYQVKEQTDQHEKAGGFPASYSEDNTRIQQIWFEETDVDYEMLGKKSNLTYDEAKIRCEHFRARCLEDKNKSKQLGGNKLLEKGFVDSLYGKKSKCVLNIVPKDSKIKSFKMSPKCKIDRLNSNKCMI